MAPRKKTILVVENAESERKQLAGLLDTMGYDVFEAATSDDAVREFAQKQPDLVIVEILIPGIGGLAVCKAVKDRAPDWSKVIVTSKLMQSRAMRTTAIERFRADVFLQKPFEIGELARYVSDLIGPGEVLRPGSAASANPTPKGGESEEPTRASLGATSTPSLRVRERESLEFPSSGEFDARRIPALLVHLMESGFTGALKVEGDPGVKHIYFIDGAPVFVQSGIRSESLGRMLVDDGVIDEGRFQTVMNEAAQTGKKVGNLLVANKILTAEELTSQLCRQTALKIAHLFSWSGGRYQIDNATHYPENSATFEPHPAAAFLLGYERHVPVSELEARFDVDKKAFPVRTAPPAIFQGFENELNAEQRSFLNTIDGTANLAQVVAGGAIPMLTALRTFYAFVDMGCAACADAGMDEPHKPTAEAAAPVAVDVEAFTREINQIAARLEEMSPHELLGLDADAAEDHVEEAYRRRLAEFDPDKLGFEAPIETVRRARAVRRRLAEAYRTLTDPEAAPIPKKTKPKPEEPEDPEVAARKKKIDAELLYQKGLAACDKRRWTYAVECFDRALNLDPNTAEYQARSGLALFKLLTQNDELWESAIDRLGRAVKLDPENIEFRLWLADAVRTRGDAKLAFKMYRKILELAPTHEEAKRQVHYLGQAVEADRVDDAPKRSGLSLFGRKK